MRAFRIATTCALASFLAFSAGTALGQRIDGIFFFEDENSSDLAGTAILFNGTRFAIEGSVGGIGTAGDEVQISFIADIPTQVNADDAQGRVRQNRFSRITFLIISDTPARDLDLVISPEKCAIDGKVDVAKDQGKVTVDCSASDLFAGLTADQIASIQAAFLENPKVKIKVNADGAKGSVKISSKGELLDEA